MAALKSPIAAIRKTIHDSEYYHIQLRQKDLTFRVPQMWLIDVKVNGEMAVRSFDFDAQGTQVVGSFAASSYRHDNRMLLRTQMRAALVADGLFVDEAEAMLETWKQSYFRNHGKRLFYVMPRQWTDATLPLTISSSQHDLIRIERSMVGRIELMTVAQEKMLDVLAAHNDEDRAWYDTHLKTLDAKDRAHLRCAGPNIRAAELEELGFHVADGYRAYMELGRFRDAFIFADPQRYGSWLRLVFRADSDLKPESLGK